MLGELVGQPVRAVDDDVVVLRRAVRRIGVRQVRDGEQDVAELGGDAVVLDCQRLLALAEGTALAPERFGAADVAVPAEAADLLRDLVDFGAEFVRLARSVYMVNDRRAAIKSRIDGLSGSSVREMKSYTDY